ncbi:MAG: hypothetical protein KDK62_04880 [Chlamydiia bacterium]|nr:hypothetical protein [Chlamydiia bacterium]
MQIYAYDSEGNSIAAHHAKERQNYFCPDCHEVLRVRSGPFVRTHFYHFKPLKPCPFKGKTLKHIKVQEKLLTLLPEAKEEVRFLEIGRIADIFWEKEKLVFEVQVSFISAKEVQERNEAYASLGLQVIWILHRSRFDCLKIPAAQKYLRSHPHYFSNHDDQGQGQFYDRFLYEFNGIKQASLFFRSVDLSKPVRSFTLDESLPPSINQRLAWPIAFEGDILTSNNFRFKDLQRAKELEAFLKRPLYKDTLQKKISRFFRFIGYLLLHQA